MKHKNSALKSLKKEKTKERKRGRDKEVLQKRKYKHGGGQKKRKENLIKWIKKEIKI